MKERAEQCEMYWVGRGGGRCAQGGGRTERHHVQLRSEPAHKCPACRGDTLILNPVTNDYDPCPECGATGLDPRELADICTGCHARIHRTLEPWLYRVELPDGEIAYVEAPSKASVKRLMRDCEGLGKDETVTALLAQEWISERHGEVVVFGDRAARWKVALLWSNVGTKIDEAVVDDQHEVELGAMIAKAGAWRCGQACYRLERMGDAWKRLGFRTFSGFAQAKGFAPRTLRAYRAAERTLQESPNIKPSQRERLRALPIELMITARQPVSLMTTKQIDRLLDQADGNMPLKDLIDEAKELAGMVVAKKKGKRHAQVTLIAKAATIVTSVEYGPGENPVELAKSKIGAFKHIFVIDWASKKQQTWEETKDE